MFIVVVYTLMNSFLFSQCGKAFKNDNDFKLHLKLDHPVPPTEKIPGKSHVCLTCHKAFGKPSQLERHIRIHTGGSCYMSCYMSCYVSCYGHWSLDFKSILLSQN